MAIGVKEDVFRFKISIGHVDDVVQVAEDQCNFGGIELDRREGETACSAEVREYFAARCVFELECIMSE